MKTGIDGQNVVKHYESIHDGDLFKIDLQPKEDPVGIWTVGWGHALFDPQGNPLEGIEGYNKIPLLFPQFMDMTVMQADILFSQDLIKFESLVNRNLKRQILQKNFDALISFTFNCGYSETLFSLVNNVNQDVDAICNWWEKHYITSNGVVKQGLIYRRKTESTLFRTGIVKFYN
jgi:lysozyme